jgi:hypothetical protein
MRIYRFSAIAALIAGATALSAQMPNASAAATGLGGAFTARARGYDAVAWNPANLGLRDNPDFSLAILAFHGSSGLDPISLSDFAPYSGKQLPSTQREAWLQTVANKGGQNGRVDGGITPLAVSMGPIAIQVSAAVAGSTKLSPDAFEAVMFGNAGRTGVSKDLNLAGSAFRVGAFTTAAASYGIAFGESFSLGVTGKYIVGNALGIAEDQGSTTTQSAVTVNFPMVYSRPDSDVVIGNGMGADIGMAFKSGRMTFGATVQNAFNSFKWDESKLRSKSGTALFNGTDNDANFDDQPYASAPASLRTKVADDKFKPIVAAGIAYDVASSLTFSADVRQQLGDALLLGPKTQAGAGIEFRGIPVLKLRAGASYITDGWGVSGGLGLDLGVLQIGAGAALRTVNGGKEPVVTLNVLSFR